MIPRTYCRYKFLITFGLGILVMAGCSVKSDKHSATEPLENTNSLELGTKYYLDADASVITWIGSRPARQHNGTIAIHDGLVAVADTGILGGIIEIDISSIDIKDMEEESEEYRKLKDHLLSDAFFYADSFPTATFELTRSIPYDSTYQIKDKEEFESENTPARLSEFIVRNPTHQLSGNLTIRGITKGITFPATLRLSEKRIFCEAKFNIDRTQWSISYNDESTALDKIKDKFIYNTVNVGFSFQAVRVE